jgi:hypothetical protein
MAISSEEMLDINQIVKAAHWSPVSQPYAGADHLLHALNHGWQPDPVVRLEEHWRGTVLPIRIYHVMLYRGDARMNMPVINTPHLEHILIKHGLQVVPITRDLIMPPARRLLVQVD